MLSISATSAPSERVFKAADDHITHDRNRLKPDNASKLIFMQQALKKLDMSLYDLCFNSDYACINADTDEEREELEVVESDAATEGDENDGCIEDVQLIDIDDDVHVTAPDELYDMYQYS